jgi:hypothetical protein
LECFLPPEYLIEVKPSKTHSTQKHLPGSPKGKNGMQGTVVLVDGDKTNENDTLQAEIQKEEKNFLLASVSRESKNPDLGQLKEFLGVGRNWEIINEEWETRE